VSTQTWLEMMQEIRDTFPYEVYRERIFDHIFYNGKNTLWIKYNDTKIITRALLNNINEDIEKMRKSKEPQKQESKSVEKPTFGGYKNINLTDEELERFDVMLTNDATVGIETMQWLLTMGKITLQDDYGKFVSTITCVHDGKLWSLSAFASNFHESLLLLSYKIDLYPEWLTSENTSKRIRG